MNCPKCDFAQPEGGESCLRCGVIFAKVQARREAEAGPANSGSRTGASDTDGTTGWWGGIKERLFIVPPEPVRFFVVGRAILYLLMLVWGWRFVTATIAGGYASETPLHLINLPFHEAGHVIFGLLGNRFFAVLGGTLGQLVVPAIVIAAFILRHDPFGSSVGLWWLGQSCMDVAFYANDARAGQLPLLGGVTGSEVEDYHDWEVLLGKLGWLQYDHSIAKLFYGCGTVLMLLALAWGGYLLWRQSRPVTAG